MPKTPAAFIVGFLSSSPVILTAKLNWDIPSLLADIVDKPWESDGLSERTREKSVHLVETVIGVLGATGESIVEHVLFPRDPKQIAAALDRQRDGEVTKETTELVEKLMQRGFKGLVVSNEALAKTIADKYGLDTETSGPSGPSEYVRDNLEALAVEYGWVEDAAQLQGVNHEVSMQRAQRAVRRAQSARGAVIPRMVQLLNELDKTLNVLSSKLREWYGLHFPELDRQVDGHENYARIVESIGDRFSLEPDELATLGFKPDKASRIVNAAQGSMGAPMSPDDLELQQALASRLLSLYEYREELEDHISSTAQEVAPNLSNVAGPVLAAKLIEKGGGLRKLAMRPSGAIQILGAEKALFRAKKTRARPPKHGLIFQHPFVHSKKRKLRGRSARVLAAKLAIAARADAFTGNYLGSELLRQLEEYERGDKPGAN
jgi:nucleolar protein 56